MKLQEIREMARTVGLSSVGKKKKVDLVREIQRHEGNYDCFATAQARQCDQMGCLWRGDCFKLAVS